MMKRIMAWVWGLALVAGPLMAEARWHTSFEEARKLAEREDRDLLLDFTGTDWCVWCIRLKNEVFEQPAFKSYAAKHLVLVELDFPRKRKLAPELTEQNRRLAEEMAINGYPTVMLCDGQGRPYARTGYRPGGAEPYLEHLKELRKIHQQRDEAFARAAELDGVEKAGALLQGLGCMDDDLADLAYGEVVAEILRLDPEDVHGLTAARREKREHEEAVAARAELLKTFFTGTIRPMIERGAYGELDGALAEFLEKHPELPDTNRQVLIYNVGLARYRADGDDAAMGAVIDRLAREFPESDYARRGEEMKNHLKAHIEKSRSGPDGE